MPITYLPLEHHVVRYVPWSRLRKDEDDNVIGVLGAAFKLRAQEDYLSATWAEFFQGTRADCIFSAIKAIRASSFSVTPRSGFAIGNVGRVKDACLADKQRHRIRIIHEPEHDNKAHSALRGWPRDNDPLLDLLAEDMWSETVLNKDVPHSNP
jgi:hypothetical protein